MYSILTFWIATFAIVAGVVLGYPVVRAIARAIEERFVVQPRKVDVLGASGADTPLLHQMENRISELEREQQRLQDQQTFLESLLEKRDEPPALPPTDEGG